jgi:hypothetical protein
VISFKILVLKLWVPPALSQFSAQQVTFIPLSENFVPDLIYLGAAVARTLLKDGTFIPRAITRNPESAAALKLMAEGIAVVKADPLDKPSLVGAMCSSEAVFAAREPTCSFARSELKILQITTPIFPLKAEGEGPNEVDQGKNMVDAAKEADIKFFIFTYDLSTLCSLH